MPEDEFEIYLTLLAKTLLAKTLRLNDAQRDAIAAELRDHMENRLNELTLQGIEHEQAVETALAEFGDANALATDLTRTNPARARNRRHLMQTTFGTVLTCAAVTFAVMLLTPSNKDGQPNQPSASAQDDAFAGAGGFEAVEGGFGEAGADAFGGMEGGFGEGGADAFGGMDAGGFGDMGGGEFAGGMGVRAARLELSIHVVDCTEILRPDRDRGDLLNRTAALANAVQNTVATVNPHRDRAIRVQPFEEFLIITATDPALAEALKLLDQIGEHVARRTAIQREQEHAQAQRERDAQRNALMREMHQAAVQLDRLNAELARVGAMRSELRQQHGQDHAEVKHIEAQMQALQQQQRELEDLSNELDLRARGYR